MAEESVRRRKKREHDIPATILLSNIYYLNPNNTKYILIGFSAVKDFKPLIVFCHDNLYVEFILSDWITLTINQQLIESWFAKAEAKTSANIGTKNINIKKTMKSNNPCLQINNCQQPRANNNILLSPSEYSKCIEIDLFIQNVIKSFQSNWFAIEDYYNVYVHKCKAKNVLFLEDNDYFFADNANFDCYRLFKEITYLCKDKLRTDVTHFNA